MKSSFVKTIKAVSGVLQTDGKNTSGILVEYEWNTNNWQMVVSVHFYVSEV